MKRLTLSIVVVCIFLLSIFLMSSILEAAPKEKNWNLRFATHLPPNDYMTLTLPWWGKEAEKRTGGRVKATMFPGGALGKGQEYTEMIRKGAIEGAMLDNNLQVGELPMLDIITLPFFISSPRMVMDVLYQLYYEGLLPGLNEFKVLWFQPLQQNLLFTKKKRVSEMGDIKGLKIKTMGQAAEFLKSIGGVPVPMPTADFAMALSQGTVDGTITAFNAVQLFKWYESLESVLVNPITSMANLFAMSKDIWNSFPPDIQYTLEVLNNEARYLTLSNLCKTIGIPSEAEAKKIGLQKTSLSPGELIAWKQKAQPIIDKWVTESEVKGLPAKKAYELVKRTTEGW
ncbi:MAG: TRAP transporter substrate-binding protein DctP [Deltaproteobacteria bacterium]|nr:TRAP transporter substrate-binding protein DctP [Deltaproteobacteria bacterium]